MKNTHQVYLISDSTGETLDRIFLAIKAQFPKFNYKIHHFAFMRTSAQTAQLIEKLRAKLPECEFSYVNLESTL